MLLIIGGDSMIGRSLLSEASREGLACSFTSRRPGSKYFLDLSDPLETWQLPPNVKNAVFCASMTGLAACGENPEKSCAVNVTATLALADLLASRGTRIVFLSSNQVFGPDASVPSEEDLPAPTTEYGRQKQAVEQHFLENISGSQIIRLTKVVSPALPLFAKWAATLADQRPITAYTNLHFSPIAIDATAAMILKISNSSHSGIFHLSASDAISYLDAARWIAARIDAAPALVQSAPTPTLSTPDSCRLKCERTQHLIGFSPLSSLQTLTCSLRDISLRRRRERKN